MWSVEWRVWRAECEVWGASLNSLCAVRHLIQYSPCREPNFCVVSKRNWSGGLASSPICHLLASLLFSPFFLLVVAWGAHFGLAALVPKLPPMCFYAVCTSPFVLSPLVLVLHTGPRKGNCVSPFVCLITALCILLSFLWLLWDEGFLVFPITLSIPMTALGQFSFRQVSPLGSPFVSLLVAALRRRNSYVFHVSNDIIRCPLWPQCYWHMSFDCHHWLSRFQYVFCEVIPSS